MGTDLRVTDLYTAGSFDPDHDAVMRIGGEAPGGGPILSVGMDHMRLDATRRKPARQPKAVAPGFEGQRHPGDRVAGPGRLIPPAMQQSKQPFWARLQLFAWLTLNAGKHTGEQRGLQTRCVPLSELADQLREPFIIIDLVVGKGRNRSQIPPSIKCSGASTRRSNNRWRSSAARSGVAGPAGPGKEQLLRGVGC